MHMQMHSHLYSLQTVVASPVSVKINVRVLKEGRSLNHNGHTEQLHCCFNFQQYGWKELKKRQEEYIKKAGTLGFCIRKCFLYSMEPELREMLEKCSKDFSLSVFCSA